MMETVHTDRLTSYARRYGWTIEKKRDKLIARRKHTSIYSYNRYGRSGWDDTAKRLLADLKHNAKEHRYRGILNRSLKAAGYNETVLSVTLKQKK